MERRDCARKYPGLMEGPTSGRMITSFSGTKYPRKHQADDRQVCVGTARSRMKKTTSSKLVCLLFWDTSWGALSAA